MTTTSPTRAKSAPRKPARAATKARNTSSRTATSSISASTPDYGHRHAGAGIARRLRPRSVNRVQPRGDAFGHEAHHQAPQRRPEDAHAEHDDAHRQDRHIDIARRLEGVLAQ